MFGRKKTHENDDNANIPVDATLEGDIQDVEQAIVEYLNGPTDGSRRSLLAVLERLDAQTARGDSFENSVIGSPGFGYSARDAVLGQTSIDPVVDQVRAGEMKAQVALVKAAKAEVRTPSPDTFAALKVANASLAATRTAGPPTA